MSFNFDCGKRVPMVDEALREAYEHGVVTVASAGNLGSESCVSAPATGPRVIGVGGTTEGGCLGGYSLAGAAIDLVAPGGGVPQSRLPLGRGAADLPGDAAARQHQRIRDPGQLRRHLDGRRPRLRRRGDGPRQRRGQPQRCTPEARVDAGDASACARPPATSACPRPSRAPA